MAVSRTVYLTKANLSRKTESWLAELHNTRGRLPLTGQLNGALVVVDLQRIFCAPDSPAYLPAWAAVRQPCFQLIEFFLNTKRRVVFTRHLDSGPFSKTSLSHFFPQPILPESPLSQLIPEVQPYVKQSVVIEKNRLSAWSNPQLRRALAGCDYVVLAGVQIQLCVLTTALGAAEFNYIPIIVADACAAPNVSLHKAALSVLSSGHAHLLTSTELIGLLQNRSGHV